MKALVFRTAGQAEVVERPIPVPGPDEVLVRVAVCGVCGSDAAEFDHGPILTSPPVVLGHEFAGTVEAVGASVTAFAPGNRVVCGAGVSCGQCRQCHRGRTNLCATYWTTGLQRDGGLAEYVVAPASVLLDVSDSPLTLDTLGLAQPMSIAVHAVRRSGVGPDDNAVIVGAGGIGAFLIVAAAAVAARVVVVDLDPARLELAARLGATATLDPRDGSLTDQLDALDVHPDVLFEVSGSAAGLASVLGAARPGSTIVPVGIQRADVTAPLASWTVREYTIVGTNAHVFSADLAEAVRLLATRDDWSDIAPTVHPLDRTLDDGLIPLSTGASQRIKTLIDPSATHVRAADHHRS
ncbi:zinc-dependent alcohol dehydrogenase [Microcella sp.]|uniref:zinc-dependent alcohol dehydrogenase n=1 Tax=Microcella sp. TaxID=1913979 RepID=UPI00391AAA84